MKILWFNWKDLRHPGAGGAEVVLDELSKRLAADGHEVTILTSMYPGALPQENRNGISYIRVGGNRYLHSFRALLYYVRHLRGQFDIVIEVVNTAPYFGVLVERRAKTFAFYHQLAREIWFYETKFPLDYIGYYLLEPVATRLIARANAAAITVSDSTKQDLMRYGFKKESIHIISEGIELEPLTDLGSVDKYPEPTLLSLGAIRPMKRTHHQIKAFELAKKDIPNLKLKVAGGTGGTYGQGVLKMIEHSPYRDDIEVLGRVSQEQKIELMQKAHAILVTSVKEGWGLIVTEAASQGTPAAVYNVDGLRDSVQHGKSGLISQANTPQALAAAATGMFQDKHKYDRMRSHAWHWSKDVTFEQSYRNLKDFLFK